VFYPAAEYRITTRITRVDNGEHAFKTEGKVLVNPGWLAVYGKEAAVERRGRRCPSLVVVEPGENPGRRNRWTSRPLVTKPPPRFNEATLLSAMEGAGKMVDDEELRAAMAGRGLGTPATRAQIIENLISETYLHRDGKELIPTAKAFSLITLLRGLGVTELTSPELTGEWEYKLAQMERGKLSRDDFMGHITALTRDIVERAKRYESDTVPGDFATLKTPCPKCGGVVKENYKKFACQACDWSAWKIVAGRQFEVEEMETLMSAGKVGPLHRLPQQDGAALRRRNPPQRRQAARVRLRPAQGGRGSRGGGFLRSRKAWASAPSAAPGLPARQRLRLRTQSSARPRAAISAAAR
jgi:DNA topoisomerase-3